MTRNDLLALWPQLTPSARRTLLQQVKILVGRHSGTIELLCYQGGVRRMRIGKDYKPDDGELPAEEENGLNGG